MSLPLSFVAHFVAIVINSDKNPLPGSRLVCFLYEVGCLEFSDITRSVNPYCISSQSYNY